MDPRDKKAPDGARGDTDKSLRDERAKADVEMGQRREALEADSDAVVQRARDRADDVLSEARGQADRVMEGEPNSERIRGAVARERHREDSELEQERAVEDEVLGEEREEGVRALRQLLRIEREATDQHLLVERAETDLARDARDDVMGMVSHDLRTLLGGIALNAELIVSELATLGVGSTIPRRVAGIQRFAARMERLVGDLVDLASIETGALHVTPVPGDAAPLLAETAEGFAPAAAAKRLTLAVEGGDTAMPARFDRDRISQVLANLVSNAIKFTPAGGRILLRVERVPGHVRFSVADTGAGIAAANHEAVFERFWQVDKTDRRGVGLGLYISRSIVAAHGGTIELASTPGQGSTFSFMLPAA